jgi:hypothetical protein
MGKNKFKKLKAKNTPHISLREKLPPDYNSKKPIFSFRYMKYQSNNCVSRCDENTKASIIETLVKLSQLTWNQIISTPSTGLGCESINCSQFRLPLPTLITPDVTSLNIFRYSEAGRIAGYRETDIYHILVVGPNLYNH